VLVEGEVAGQLVETPTGDRLIYTRLVGPGSPQSIESVDVRTGETKVVLTRGMNTPLVTPKQLRLPEGWVLLVTFSLGDFPQAAPGPRAVPILVDLVTGQQFEMENLPH
jgi:hypothetical protein